MKKSALGFTLIELVIVIIILGILAATATAKYINLRGDAINSTNETTAGALRSALELARMKLKLTYGGIIPVKGYLESGDPNNANDDLGFYKGYPECSRLGCGLNGITRTSGCRQVVSALFGRPLPYSLTMQSGSNLTPVAVGHICVFSNRKDSDYQFRYDIKAGTVVTSQP